MRRSRNIFIGAMILIVFSGFLINLSENSVASSHKPTNIVSPSGLFKENPHVQKLLTEYESGILELLEKTQAPGVAIAIVKDTSVIYIKGFGVREIGKPDSIDEHTVFRLASVSKTFAPLLTGLLVEDKKLSWNDKVIKYVPDFSLKNKDYTQALTLRHVLSHTTGLPYHTYTNMVEEGKDLKTMLAMLKDVNVTNKPGEVYSYQNVAYSLIAEVVKKATGKTYEQLMAERVFKPLGMKDASMTYAQIMANPNVAKPHLYRRSGWAKTKILNTYYNVAPAGGINASISDMAQLLKGIIGSRTDFIREQTLEEIFKPEVKATAKNRNFRKWIEPADSYYAMGWRVLNFRSDTLMYHGGYVNGYRSELAINRKDKIGICVLSNAPGNMIDNSVPFFFKLFFTQRDSINYWQSAKALMLQEEELMKR